MEEGKRNVEESWAIIQATAVPDQTPATNSRTREEPGREQTLPSEPSLNCPPEAAEHVPLVLRRRLWGWLVAIDKTDTRNASPFAFTQTDTKV